MEKKKILIIASIIVFVLILIIIIKKNGNKNVENTLVSEPKNNGETFESYNEINAMYELYSQDTNEYIGEYRTQEDLEIAKEFYKEHPDYKINLPEAPNADTGIKENVYLSDPEIIE